MEGITTTVKREALPTAALGDLECRVSELNRRATKLGVAPIRVVYGTPYVQVEKNEATGFERRREVVDVEVIGETPKLAGWTLVAVLDHDGPETVLSRVPGVEVELSAYRDAKPYCSHCRTTRKRLETFVVIHEDGRLAQVGRNCLADFLGGQSPAGVLWLAGWVREISGALDEGGEFWGGSNGPIVLDPVEYLSAVAACIRLDGWLSRGKAYEQDRAGAATANEAWDVLTLSHTTEETKRHARERQGTEADVELAKATLAWAQALDPADQSEYLSNLGRLARKGYVKVKDSGLIASAVASYSKVVEREREQKAALKSEWFGEVGTRYRRLTLTVLGVSYHESQFGTTTLVRYTDAEGRRFKWWASGSQSLNTGERYVVDATVKDHETYNDVKQTVLSRVSECQLDAAAAKVAVKAQKALDHAMKHVRAHADLSAYRYVEDDPAVRAANEVLYAAQRRVIDAQAAAESVAFAALQEGC